MNIYELSAFINIISSSVLGISVWFQRKNRPVNTVFSFFALCIFVWSLPYFLWQISDAEYGLILTRLLMVGAIFIPITYLHFVYAFVETLDKRKRFIQLSYILFSIFALLDATPYMVDHVEPLYGFVAWPIAGSLFWIFLAIWIWYASISLYTLMTYYYRTRGVTKYQTLYILIGTFVGSIGGITNYFLWYHIPIPPFGNIAASLYLIFIAYAILRYRLMDIRMVAQKTFIYVCEAVFVYVSFYALLWSYKSVAGDPLSRTGFTIGVFLAPLFIYLLFLFDRGIKSFSNRYLFVSLYNYQDTLGKLAEKLSNYIELDTIVDLIVDTIKQTMQLDRAGVLLVDNSTTPAHYKIARVIGFNEQNGISLVEDNFMTQYLFETHKPLVSDELVVLSKNATSPERRDGFMRLYDQMTHIEASLCLPLIGNKTLIGIIVMGNKISHDAYTSEDLELLSTITQQASVAIENALQYQQIKDFGKTLEAKVDEQTEFLRRVNEELEEKNNLNQELLEMKSDFLRVVNHQLNTPISIMRGYFGMMKTGQYSPEKALPIIESGIDRISQTVSDFWDAYELEGERMKMSLAPVDITSIVNTMIVEKQNLTHAKNKNLAIGVEQPTFPIPTVW